MSNLPFVNIPTWVPDQVVHWLRGLDDSLLPYSHYFLNAGITGKQLLFLEQSDLQKLGVIKIGHRELILEAVEMLHSLYHQLETQTLQSFALQMSCKALSLRNEIDYRMPNILAMSTLYEETYGKVPIHIMTAVSDIVGVIKQIVSWLDRSPFDTSDEYIGWRDKLIGYGMVLLDTTQKHNPYDVEKEIMEQCLLLSQLGDRIVQDSRDPLVIQPLSLEITTIRKKPEDDLGMHIQSLYNGIHVIGAIKDQSPADLCGKVEEGDEVIQVNYQTVVGWHLNKLVAALKDNKKEVTLTLKKRPRHINPFGPQNHRKKVPKNVKQSTFPKAFRRKSREEKGTRAPLKEFMNSLPAPFTKDSSAEPDSDNESEVFQTLVTTPCLLPLPLESTKQRRATVSGGSPPSGKRNSLEIVDISSTGRPKSYTISSSPSSDVASLLGSPVSSDLMSPRFLDDTRVRDRSPTKEVRTEMSDTSIISRTPVLSPETIPTITSTPEDLSSDISDTVTMTTSLTITPPSSSEQEHNHPTMTTSHSDHNIQLMIPVMESPLKPRKGSDASGVVADVGEKKSSPQLLRITRITSTKRAEMYEQWSSDEQEGSEERKGSSSKQGSSQEDLNDRPQSFSQSYTVNVVGGVPQKVAVNREMKDSPTQSPSGLLRRKHFMKRMGATRRISCKDLGGGECQGWLWRKKEGSGLLHSKWIKRWFVLKHKNIYYYKSQEDEKAHGVIHLPGFKVSPAPEIKSKKFAFKAFHTGMTFYFAAERQDDMGKWMNKMGLAAIVYDTSHIQTTAGFNKPDKDGHMTPADSNDVLYSESDEENESLASGYSTPSSPHTPRRGVSPAHSSRSSSREDLTNHENDELVEQFANIRRADIGFDGQSSRNKRKSNLSKAGELDLKNTQEVELHRKLHSLCRTLKERERELKIIEDFLLNNPPSVAQLSAFKAEHPDIMELLQDIHPDHDSSDGSIRYEEVEEPRTHSIIPENGGNSTDNHDGLAPVREADNPLQCPHVHESDQYTTQDIHNEELSHSNVDFLFSHNQEKECVDNNLSPKTNEPSRKAINDVDSKPKVKPEVSELKDDKFHVLDEGSSGLAGHGAGVQYLWAKIEAARQISETTLKYPRGHGKDKSDK